MTSHKPQRIQVSAQQMRCTPSTILVIDAMKTVASDSRFKPFVGSRVHRRRQRHGLVKTSVENCDLTHTSEQFLDCLHALQFCTIMQRSKGRNTRDRRFYFRRDDNRVLKFWTTVHHPVSDDVNLRGRSYGARFTLPQSIQQMLDGLGTRGNLNAVFSGESALILDLRLCGLALPFDLRLPKATRRIIRQNVADLV